MKDPKAVDSGRPAFLERVHQHSKLLAVLIAVLVSLVYGNTLLNGYSIDDDLIVYGNAQAEQGFSGIEEILTTNYFTRGAKKGSYRGLPRATFAIEHEIVGANPTWSHAINVLFFFMTCWLVLQFLFRLFPVGKNLAVLLALLLFTVHPIHTEVVASLKNRDELMQLMFSLAACIFLIDYARKGNLLKLLGSMIMFLAALMSKETAIQFLAVFPLVFYYAGKLNIKHAVIASVGLLATTILLAGFMVLYLDPDAVLWMDTALDEYLFIEHPLMHTEEKSIIYGTGFYGLSYYLRLFVFPYPLGFYYGFDQITLVSLTDIQAIASIVLILGLGILGLSKLKRRSMLGLGILITLICLSIFSNLLVQVSGIIAERFAYSSSLGYCMVVGFGIQFLVDRFSKLKTLILGFSFLIIAVMAYGSIDRNADWKSYLSLAENDARTFKNSAVTHLYLAVHIQNTVLDTAIVNRENWINQLVGAYQEVVRIHPDSKTACRYVVLETNKFVGSDSLLSTYKILFAAGLQKDQPNDYLVYSDLLVANQMREDAIPVLNSWIERKPEEKLAYQKAAENLLSLNRKEALETLVDTMEMLFPESDLPVIYRGNLAMMTGQPGLALEWFEKALRLNPDNTELYDFLISQYIELRMPEKTANLKLLVENAKTKDK